MYAHDVTPRPPSFPTRRSSDLNDATRALDLQLLRRRRNRAARRDHVVDDADGLAPDREGLRHRRRRDLEDRKSTRLNSSHVAISYAVFCLKKKTISFDFMPDTT